MSQAAGNIDIELKLKSGQYTAAMKEAQREAAKFGGGMKTAGHTSITSVQAVSANLRAMEGGFNNNLRAVERWIAQSKVATTVAKTMFPLVGALTFGGMILDMGMKVATFIEKARSMPKAIEAGFASMHLAAETSTDALRLTNDQLQNSINKLQGKSQNNLAIQIDEARIAADKLATSLENDASKVKALLEENKISALGGLLTGNADTSGVAGTVNFGAQEIAHLGRANREAVGKYGADSPEAKQAATNLGDKQNYYQQWIKQQLFLRDNPSYATGDDNALDMAGDQAGNRNILQGFRGVLDDRQDDQAEVTRKAKLAPQKAALDAQKATSEASKAAATARVEAMQTGLDAMKLQYGMSLRAVYDYWEQMKSGELAGSTAYNEIIKKQVPLAVEAAAKAHEAIAKYRTDAMHNREQDGSIGSTISRIGDAQNKDSLGAIRTQNQGYQESNSASADEEHNKARLQELAIQQALGVTLTHQAAALQLAAVHAAEYKTELDSIAANRKLNADAPATTEQERQQKQRRDAQFGKQYADLQTQADMQAAQDKNAANPQSTSALVGASDALTEFVNVSRDAAGMMRDIVSSTLSGLNNQIANSITGGKTDFKQVGVGALHGIATAGLQKAEGSILGAFGLGGGKMGSKGNPMYTRSADTLPGADGKDAGSDISKLGGGLSSLFGKAGGGFSSFLGKAGGLLKMALPFLATGGPIDGPAIVGEKGPELFVPSGSGQIVPNHQLTSALTSSSGGGQNITYSIDARGTDAVQVESRVRSAIVAAHQSSVTQAVKQVQQQGARQPQRSR